MSRGLCLRFARCFSTKVLRPARRKGLSSCSVWLPNRRPGSKTHDLILAPHTQSPLGRHSTSASHLSRALESPNLCLTPYILGTKTEWMVNVGVMGTWSLNIGWHAMPDA